MSDAVGGAWWSNKCNFFTREDKYRIYSDRATAFSSSTSVLKPGFVLDTICDTLIYSEGDWMVVVGSVVSQNSDADELIINRL